MSQDNSPKVILITGCSSGFGLLMAARFAEYGEQIIATVRSEDKKVPLKNEALERETEIDIQYLDVTDKKMTSELMKHITKEYGYIDVLINNAGYGIGGAFEDLTDEEFREQMEVNFFGVLNMTRAALPFMRCSPSFRWST